MTARRDTRAYRALCDWLKAQRLPCAGCGEHIRYDLTGKDAQRHPKAFTLDHIVPVSKGGQNTRENSRAMCRSCNSARGNRSTPKRRDNSRRW